MDRKKFAHQIEVTLTEQEVLEKLHALAVVDREVAAIKAEKAVAMADFNQKLREKTKVQTTLLDTIGTAKEKRELECYHERDERRGLMLTMRFDNDEIVDERALTIDELNEGKQKDLPFDEPAPARAAATDPNTEARDDVDLSKTLEDYEANDSESEDDNDDEDPGEE